MAEDLLAGSILGAALGELLKAVLDLMKNGIRFKSVLQDITSQVQILISVTKQLDGISNSDHSQIDTQNLREVIDKGKQLILKCDSLKHSILYHPKAPFYTKKLLKFDAELGMASRNLILQLNVQQLKALQAMQSNEYGYARLVKKIKNNKNCSCLHNFANLRTTNLPLLFYHDKRRKGKTGPNSFDGFVGRAVEHIKDEPKEGVAGRIEKKIMKCGEGRYEKIFHRTFDSTVADEKLQNWFACDLSMEEDDHGCQLTPGVLFVSTAKLAFCSCKPTPNSNNTKSLYLKVVIPLQLLQSVGRNPCDRKYIEAISIDGQKFCFTNFRNINEAEKSIQESVTPSRCTRCTHTL